MRQENPAPMIMFLRQIGRKNADARLRLRDGVYPKRRKDYLTVYDVKLIGERELHAE